MYSLWGLGVAGFLGEHTKRTHVSFLHKLLSKVSCPLKNMNQKQSLECLYRAIYKLLYDYLENVPLKC